MPADAAAAAPDPYFVAHGEGRYAPTAAAEGAWQPGEMHFAPLGGLLTHAIEAHRIERHAGEAAPLRLSRMTFDILGFLALEETTVRVETRRPGRTIELTEATASIAGRDVAVARAWHSVAVDTAAVAGGDAEPLPAPAAMQASDFAKGWGGGYVHSVEFREDGSRAPGRNRGWQRTAHPLVAGEAYEHIAAWIGLIDGANGIAVREQPDAWMFPNLDLTIHLHREPEGAWVGYETTVSFGPAGQGITHTALHDERGHVGFALQTLTVRPSPLRQ
ncbi:Thioesterase-like superfamily protein [Agrococcus baldri]|uniref:Thioesterase-like superfamily protein n=1 Tax=Agrococcus baldri TaxID=153730 RepID=A0AA94L0J2_9MICO|nr:thioesterase family protein [Agrococcus baldri]SFS18117.1 Thioesterase-like superfamily protein [Agrococcus baldri]